MTDYWPPKIAPETKVVNVTTGETEFRKAPPHPDVPLNPPHQYSPRPDKLPAQVFIYRDLNGTLMACEDIDAIPHRMIDEKIGVYDYTHARTFGIKAELHD